MPIVYRIQDAEGRGPFKPGFIKKWVEYRLDHNNLQPWFIEFGRVDKQISAEETSGCACKSLEQLRRWFTKREYTKLKKLGYKAVRIKVDHIIEESDIQCFVSRSMPFYETEIGRAHV